MYNESTTLMLSKGIYDRPPMLNYPKHVEYIQEESIFSGYLSKKRSLSALELTEIFLNIERNYFGLLICMGFTQVVKDEEIKRYLLNGKRICEKQIQILNKILIDEGHLGTVPVTMQVTDSKVSPFSDKLIVFLFHTLNSLDITLIGHGLSMSMRTDLSTIFSRLIGEILVYGKEGFDIMVKRRWLEQPPQ
ncbi:DUF3231 family protein [Ammoniphilus sp. CFH 90114]|uniref:DUF3231 family protein n=1 Tax=Ammoniphilus sp. CFH 90114 TaxID=2493665 RepID=UPI001F0C86A1|nr:DUF3231 family protein [Ammoniphilus sp. CFH 90114]